MRLVYPNLQASLTEGSPCDDVLLVYIGNLDVTGGIVYFVPQSSSIVRSAVSRQISFGSFVEERRSEEDKESGATMVRMGNTSVSSNSPPSPSLVSSTVFHNYPLISALIAFALAQSIKFFTTWYKEKRWDPKQLIGSGGMPSSHSATVTALAIAVGYQDGFDSSLFAASMIFASIVMYDAFGVRLHAGKQAEVLNQIMYELPAEHPLAETRPLRELLGHTPTQVVAGAFLGFFIASIARFLKQAAAG